MTKSSVVLQRLTLAGLRQLGRVVPPAVTVLLPAQSQHRGQPIGERIRLAVDTVFHRLLAESWSPHEIARLVTPALSFAEEGLLQEGHPGGLALFADRRDFHCFEVPPAVPEVVCVGCHFFVRPLLGWLTQPERFLILNLGAGAVHLIGCESDLLTPLPLPRGVPQHPQDLGSMDTGEPNRMGKGHCGRGKSQTSAISFGIGSANPDRRLRFFCMMVDRALHGYLSEQGLPLVLAGPDDMVRVFRQESTYQNLVPCSLRGEIDLWPAERILEQARRLIQRERTQEAVRHLVEMEEYAPGERWSAELPLIVRESAQGRVWRLFLHDGATVRGSFEELLGHRTAGRPLVEDILNAAAVETLHHGGEVFVVEAGQLPDRAPAAALFRYSIEVAE